eukprot:sb/3478106/
MATTGHLYLNSSDPYISLSSIPISPTFIFYFLTPTLFSADDHRTGTEVETGTISEVGLQTGFQQFLCNSDPTNQPYAVQLCSERKLLRFHAPNEGGWLKTSVL